MKSIVVYSKTHCPQCDRAKELLDSKKLSYNVKTLGVDYTKEDLLELVPNARSVPQIFIDDKLIGGYTDLMNYLLDYHDL